MKYFLDTANLTDISKYNTYLPISGITTNPSILKKEGKIDFFEHMKKIREIIGMERSLHIQITAANVDGMLAEAEAVLERVDQQVFIKVPVNLDGLRVIRALKNQGRSVTATAIYTVNQGFLAMEAGADYIAPYYNRMENLNIDPAEVIRSFAAMIDRYGYGTKILAASFKNIGQVNSAFMAGAQTATLSPSIIDAALNMQDISKAVDDFKKDWTDIYGDRSISDL